MTEVLPTICEDVIRAYFRLDFGDGRFVVCPYFQNTPQRKRLGAAAEVGKGNPQEIVAETIARAFVHWRDFKIAAAGEIRAFMVKERIGIDCSGFAAHALEPLIKEKTGKTFGGILSTGAKSWWKSVLFYLRPRHNIDVMTLTDPGNAISVELKALQPGDLIRTRGGKHVLVVVQTERDGKGGLASFVYVHSSQAFGIEAGVREGVVSITNPNLPLEQQVWGEIWQGRRPTLEGWMEKREQNGIFRLKVLV